MEDNYQSKNSSKYTFIGFDGHYGGDEYERVLFEKLLNLYPSFELNKINVKRKGGLKSLPGFFKLIFKGFLVKGNIVRPFGIPIMRNNMTIIFHHFDQTGSPFYTKILETIDYQLIKLFSRFFDIKVITVADYWSKWVYKHFSLNSYIIYNEINIPESNFKSKRYLADKYNLAEEKQWIFLGGSQAKKGGKIVIDYLKLKELDNFQNIQLIQSGGSTSDQEDLYVVKWIEDEDYFSFIKSCDVVIANSQFEEGWCRIIHEATLLNVCVAGSGKGGMAELLDLVNNKSQYSIDEIFKIILNKELRIMPNANSLSQLKELSEENIKIWMSSKNK